VKKKDFEFRLTGVDFPPYGCLGRPFSRWHACVVNAYHHSLLNVSAEGVLPTFNGQAPVWNARVIGVLGLGDEDVEEVIAEEALRIARELGVDMPDHYALSCRDRLVAFYFLWSALCRYSFRKKSGDVESFFATKNLAALGSIQNRLTRAGDRKIGRFESSLRLTLEEITSGIFNVVKLVPTEAGYHPVKGKINIRRVGVATTAYAWDNYEDALFTRLCAGQVRLLYVEAGERKEKLTSFKEDILASWLGTSPELAQADLVAAQSRLSMNGTLFLPDLGGSKGAYFRLPLLNLLAVVDA